MSSQLPGEIPGDFEILRSRSAIVAARRDVAGALARAGLFDGRDLAMRETSLAGRARLGELAIDGRSYLLRQLRHGGLLRWLTGVRFSDPGRPFRELALSAALQRDGIATPAVVAARARRAPIFGWRLEVVTPRVDGAIDVGAAVDAIARGEVPARARRATIAACGTFVAALHGAGLRHPDLHVRNLLVTAGALRGAPPHLWVIDLDRATRSRPMDEGVRVASLARLYRDLVRGDLERGVHLERSDFARFLNAYESDRTRRRALWRAVERAFERGRAAHALSWALERRFGRRPRPGPSS